MTHHDQADPSAPAVTSPRQQAYAAEAPLFKDQIAETIRETVRRGGWDVLLSGQLAEAIQASVSSSVRVVPLTLPQPDELESERLLMAGNALTILRHYDDTWMVFRGGLTSFYCNAPQDEIHAFLEAFDTYNAQVR